MAKQTSWPWPANWPWRRAAGKTPLDRGLAWIRDHRAPGGGVVPHHKHKVGSQEVTGYLISTLHGIGERELAWELARWEASVQRQDGAFCAPDGVPYTFDTAQVVRGFLAVLEDLPEMEPHLRKACDFVVSQVAEDGRVGSPTYDLWRCADGSRFSDYANLYVLPPLAAAGRRLNHQPYVDAAEKALGYYKRQPDLVQFKSELGTLSHIFGYMMEALAELGEADLARRGLDQAAAIQAPDGSIPAYPGVTWICSTGMAQLAIAWYRIGDRRPADAALEYLETLQLPSGGFYGSYGAGAAYLPHEEISWAVKFYIDALTLQTAAAPAA